MYKLHVYTQRVMSGVKCLDHQLGDTDVMKLASVLDLASKRQHGPSISIIWSDRASITCHQVHAYPDICVIGKDVLIKYIMWDETMTTLLPCLCNLQKMSSSRYGTVVSSNKGYKSKNKNMMFIT